MLLLLLLIKKSRTELSLSPHHENRIGQSYVSLLWSLFGVTPLKELSQQRSEEGFTDVVGHSLLGGYLILAITVMVNMLIAMMSRSFQIVEVMNMASQK